MKLLLNVGLGLEVIDFSVNSNALIVKVYVAFVLLLFPEELLCYSEENYHIVQDCKTAGYYQILSYYYY